MEISLSGTAKLNKSDESVALKAATIYKIYTEFS